MTKIVSFNINGVRARPPPLEAIRHQLDADIIGLPETKVHDEQFPFDVISETLFNPHTADSLNKPCSIPK